MGGQEAGEAREVGGESKLRGSVCEPCNAWIVYSPVEKT